MAPISPRRDISFVVGIADPLLPRDPRYVNFSRHLLFEIGDGVTAQPICRGVWISRDWLMLISPPVVAPIRLWRFPTSGIVYFGFPQNDGMVARLPVCLATPLHVGLPTR